MPARHVHLSLVPSGDAQHVSPIVSVRKSIWVSRSSSVRCRTRLRRARSRRRVAAARIRQQRFRLKSVNPSTSLSTLSSHIAQPAPATHLSLASVGPRQPDPWWRVRREVELPSVSLSRPSSHARVPRSRCRPGSCIRVATGELEVRQPVAVVVESVIAHRRAVLVVVRGVGAAGIREPALRLKSVLPSLSLSAPSSHIGQAAPTTHFSERSAGPLHPGSESAGSCCSRCGCPHRCRPVVAFRAARTRHTLLAGVGRTRAARVLPKSVRPSPSLSSRRRTPGSSSPRCFRSASRRTRDRRGRRACRCRC